MTSKVIRFPGKGGSDGSVEREDLDPQKVLASAQDQQLTDVLVLGYSTEGLLESLTSVADPATILFMLEQAKMMLMQGFVSFDEA